jgi:hypothetical protein
LAKVSPKCEFIWGWPPDLFHPARRRGSYPACWW